MMFGIGYTEILVILVVALIVLGPKNLPKIARTLGKGLGEFRRVSTEFQRTINTEIEVEESTKRKKDAEARLAKRKEEDEAKEATKASTESEEPELAVAPDPEPVATENIDAVAGNSDTTTAEGKKA